MTAREMIEQEFSGKLGPQSMFGPDGNIRPGVVFAAERVIERMQVELAEQTSRANHHEERATEFASEVERMRADCNTLAANYSAQEKRAKAADAENERLRALLREAADVIEQDNSDCYEAEPKISRRIRAALGEVRP